MIIPTAILPRKKKKKDFIDVTGLDLEPEEMRTNVPAQKPEVKPTEKPSAPPKVIYPKGLKDTYKVISPEGKTEEFTQNQFESLKKKGLSIAEYFERQKLQEMQAQAQQVVPQIGVIPENLPEPVERAEQGPYGTVKNIGGAVAGAGTFLGAVKLGAAAGTAITPGVGTAIGAIGAAGGYLASLSISQRGKVRDNVAAAKSSRTALTRITNAVNLGEDPALGVQKYNEQWGEIMAAYAEIKKLNDGSLKRFLSGGMQEQQLIEDMLATKSAYDLQMLKAVNNPNPVQVIPEQFISEQ